MSSPIVYAYYQGFFAAVEMTSLPGRTAPVLVTRSGRVLDLCPRAARAGVVEGMTVGNALTRCPAARVRAPEPVRYAGWAGRVLEMAEPLSAAVEQVGANELYLDAGPAHRELIAALRDLPVPGHRLVAVLAPGRTLAGAVGRWHRRLGGIGSLDLIEVGCDAAGARAAIRDVPLEFMSPRPALATDLERLGIRTAGDVASLPPDFLAGRFGDDGYILSRLCRGYDATRLRPRDRGPCAKVHLGEDAGTASEGAVLEGIARLAADLGEALGERGCGHLRLEITCEDGWSVTRDLKPTRILTGAAVQVCLDNLWHRIRSAGIPGPVTRIRAWALDAVPVPWQQLSLTGKEQSRRQAAADLCSSLRTRFSIRLGHGKGDRRELVLSLWDPLRFGDVTG